MLNLKKAALAVMSNEDIAKLVRANVSDKPFADAVLNAIDEDTAKEVLANLLSGASTPLEGILDNMFDSHNRRTIGAVVKVSGLTEAEILSQVADLSAYGIYQGRSGILVEPINCSTVDSSTEEIASEPVDVTEHIIETLLGMFENHNRRSISAVVSATGATEDQIRLAVDDSEDFELWTGRSKTFVQQF